MNAVRSKVKLLHEGCNVRETQWVAGQQTPLKFTRAGKHIVNETVGNRLQVGHLRVPLENTWGRKHFIAFATALASPP
jgi:uncharacterized membrane protein affecting hemolysin expression